MQQLPRLTAPLKQDTSFKITQNELSGPKGPAGWSGGAMVLGKLPTFPVPGRPTVGQGPIALAVGAVGVVWTFLLSSILSTLSPTLWETARYRLKYCLKGPLNLKQSTQRTRNIICTMFMYGETYYGLHTVNTSCSEDK